jgi:poly(hydroxyalkanoate) depolymerase family esterase
VRAAPGKWTHGVAVGATGARRFRLYAPPGAQPSAPLPLVVMLHGCGQDGAAFARSTRLHLLAAREGFLVLYVEQDRLAQPQGCWNWFDTRSGRAFGEAALILAAIDQVCARHGADAARVAVAGLSAGASMAGLLATRYPHRFKAVVMHSGVAPGVARSTVTALRAMQGHGPIVPAPPALPPGVETPALMVIHGSADGVVAPRNARITAQCWADAGGARLATVRTVRRGQRYPMTMTDFKLRSRVVVTLCEIAGLAHAWSGGAAGQPYSDPKGPDAARMLWAFAARAFRAAAAVPEPSQSAAKQ